MDFTTGLAKKQEIFLINSWYGLAPFFLLFTSHISEKESVVDFKEWVIAVLGFVKQIESFYESCSPKAALKDELDIEGWKAFWQEWHRRKNRAEELLKYE